MKIRNANIYGGRALFLFVSAPIVFARPIFHSPLLILFSANYFCSLSFVWAENKSGGKINSRPNYKSAFLFFLAGRV